MRLTPCLVMMWVSATAASMTLTIGPGQFCHTGYIMDRYCINRGTMLDNGLPTLQHPGEHSVHCLVDMSICRNSGFDLLSDPGPDDTEHGRFGALDDAGQSLAVAAARAEGRCSTCVGGYSGGLTKGFRATVVGVLGSGTPPAIDTAGGGVWSASTHACPLAVAPTPAPSIAPPTSSNARPKILCLHGGGGTGAGFAAVAGMADLAQDLA